MKKGPINQFNILLVFIQGLLTVICLIAGIMSLLEPKMKILLPFCFGITLFCLAYNNIHIYKKRSFTFYYISAGIFCFVVGFMRLWG